MKKPYKVELFSELMNMEANTVDMDTAKDLYFKGINSGFYYRGHIVSNQTGEVFYHFSIEKDMNGVKVVQWAAVE